jgi:hypothetical protein
MLRTFEQTARDGRGTRFALRELTGLLIGAGREWLAKVTTDPLVRGRCLSESRPAGAELCGLPGEVVEAQKRITFLVDRMVYAIAHHDFGGARAYSYEECRERENLRMLRAKYGIME